MARPRSNNPSPRALYLRKLRESKLTPEQLRAQEMEREVMAMRQKHKDSWEHAAKQNQLQRQRQLWRAWKMWDLACKDALLVSNGEPFMPIRGQSAPMTWEEAIFILTGERGRYPNLLELYQLRPGQPRPRDLSQLGIPKEKSYLKDDGTVDQVGLCATLRKLCEAHGIQPKTPDLKGSGKPRYEKSRPVFTGYDTMKEADNLGDSPKIVLPTPYHKREDVKQRQKDLAEKRAQHNQLHTEPEPQTKTKEEAALERLKALAAPKPEPEDDDIFGDQTFTFS